MDAEEEKKLRRYALRFASLYCRGPDVEDIAQEVLLKYLENPESKQTVKQSVIDELRKRYGQKNRITKTPKRARIISKHAPTVSFDCLRALGFEPKSVGGIERREAHEYADLIDTPIPETGAPRAMFLLFHAYGLTHKEIGVLFGVTDSTICHRMKDVENHIREKLGITSLE